MKIKLIKIGDLTRDDHHYLDEDDECYYLKEYIPGALDNPANSLINNLKKKMDRKGLSDWKYKAQAIREVAEILRETIGKKVLQDYTLIPIPPSRCSSDPLYDDRMFKVIKLMCEDVPKADIRDMLFIKKNITTSHEESGKRPPPAYFEEKVLVDEALIKPEPKKILLFDDMITAGSHFKGIKNLLRREFGGDILVRGIFVTRRVLE